MKKNTLIAIFAVMACCTAAEGSGTPMANESAVRMPESGANDATIVRTAPIHVGSSAERGGGRPLGTEGLVYLLLAAFGAFAVTLASYMLITARRGGRDAAHILLGGLGYTMLIVAAFGLLMLNQ